MQVLKHNRNKLGSRIPNLIYELICYVKNYMIKCNLGVYCCIPSEHAHTAQAKYIIHNKINLKLIIIIESVYEFNAINQHTKHNNLNIGYMLQQQ